jgi:transposase
MNAPLLSDDLWTIIQPLLPPELPKPKGGRPRVPDRQALTGILFVLKTGCPWQALPKELGCGSGSTCWRRLRDWQQAGVWERLHQLLLDRLGSRGRIDWSRASLDSASIPAKRGARQPDPIRLTGDGRAPSATCWWTGTASRSRRSSARPTGTTRACWSRCWTRYGLSRGCKDARASAQRRCMRTRRTTSGRAAPRADSGVSHHASPVGASTPVSAWAGIGGSWNGH